MSDHLTEKSLMSSLSLKNRNLVLNDEKDEFLKFLEEIKLEVHLVFEDHTLINEEGSLNPNFTKG
jgi:hypothetical protein